MITGLSNSTRNEWSRPLGCHWVSRQKCTMPAHSQAYRARRKAALHRLVLGIHQRTIAQDKPINSDQRNASAVRFPDYWDKDGNRLMEAVLLDEAIVSTETPSGAVPVKVGDTDRHENRATTPGWYYRWYSGRLVSDPKDNILYKYRACADGLIMTADRAAHSRFETPFNATAQSANGIFVRFDLARYYLPPSRSSRTRFSCETPTISWPAIACIEFTEATPASTLCSVSFARW